MKKPGTCALCGARCEALSEGRFTSVGCHVCRIALERVRDAETPVAGRCSWDDEEPSGPCSGAVCKGWDVANDREDGSIEIVRCDACDRFASDAHALQHARKLLAVERGPLIRIMTAEQAATHIGNVMRRFA